MISEVLLTLLSQDDGSIQGEIRRAADSSLFSDSVGQTRKFVKREFLCQGDDL
jgi:hypothetical protein